MRVWLRRSLGLSSAALVGLGSGCATPTRTASLPSVSIHPAPPLVTGYSHPNWSASRPAPQTPPPSAVVQAQATLPAASPEADVNALVTAALASNPRLARANALVEAARGKYIQAGLRPNPVFSFSADELGDRTGPMGILGPQISQEVVLGGKLSLGQAVAAKEVDQAALTALGERYAVAAAVRAAAYDLAVLRQRRQVLAEVVAAAEKSVEQAQKAEKAPNAVLTRGDVIPLELDLERFRAELDAADRELPAAERRLAAVMGDARTPVGPLAVDLSAPLPEYDLDAARDAVVAYHPEARSAVVTVERAQAAVRRAEAELVPNVTLSAGYTRQNQNLSNDWGVGVSVPLVIRNRNEGNIRAARADAAAAALDVTRVQNDLADRLAVAFRTYAAAKQRAEKYRTAVVPKAEEGARFAETQMAKGGGDLLKVFVAQRMATDAKLEWNKAVGDAWRAAAELSGLLMEEGWPAH